MIQVQVDISDAIKNLTGVQQSQLPFALARALTKTAQDGQAAMKTRLRSIFTLRNTWTEQGMKITPAFKTSGQPFSEVIADRNYLLLQDTGGEKIAHNGNHYVAVPIRENLHTGKTGLIPPSQRPKALIQANKAFKIQLKDGRLFLFERIGRARTDIIPVYRLIPEAHIRAVLDMEGTILKVVNEKFQMNFDAAMAEAVATAK